MVTVTVSGDGRRGTRRVLGATILLLIADLLTTSKWGLDGLMLHPPWIYVILTLL